MRRVLIGDFGMIARMGLRDLLNREGLDVVAEADIGAGIIDCVSEVRPDVVLLDLDDEGALEVAARITSEFPAIKVLACSSEQPVMRVFPPFHHGESYVSALSTSLLLKALEN
jgi:DNA-binding NarL/FixJ family response regulator